MAHIVRNTIGQWTFFGIRVFLAGILAAVIYIAAALKLPGILYFLQKSSGTVLDWFVVTFSIPLEYVVLMKPLNLDDGLVFGVFYILAHIFIRILWVVTTTPFKHTS